MIKVYFVFPIKVKICLFRDLIKQFLRKSVENVLVTFAIAVLLRSCIILKSPNKECIVSTKFNSEMYEEHLEHFMISSSEDLYDDDFMFQ